MKDKEYLKIMASLKRCDLAISSLLYQGIAHMENEVRPLVDEGEPITMSFFGEKYVEDTPQNRQKAIKALRAEKIHFLTECGKLFDTAIESLKCNNK